MSDGISKGIWEPIFPPPPPPPPPLRSPLYEICWGLHKAVLYNNICAAPERMSYRGRDSGGGWRNYGSAVCRRRQRIDRSLSLYVSFSLSLSLSLFIYIYIYRDRERERDIYLDNPLPDTQNARTSRAAAWRRLGSCRVRHLPTSLSLSLYIYIERER